MRYTVPPDMSEKEKVVGGLLTMTQMFWVIAFGLVGAGVFLFIFSVAGPILGLIMALPFFTMGGVFALYKKENLTLFGYLNLKRKHKKKQKEIIHFRKEVLKKW